MDSEVSRVVNALVSIALLVAVMAASLAVIEICRHKYIKPHVVVRMGPVI